MPPTAIVTGAAGLVGAESVRQLATAGFDVVGVDNDMRARLFGAEASTSGNGRRLQLEHDNFRLVDLDVRDRSRVESLIFACNGTLELVIHAAAQPSHDWATRDPHTDFAINAGGTLNLLEALRAHQPNATFVFASTNKVYGDLPNALPLVDLGTRLDLPVEHESYNGITTAWSIDQSAHSIFGVSKLSADLMVQEYGRAFGMPTVCFRAGCLTGPGHTGAELHGFLSYLMRCVVSGSAYTVYGYDGKQVRDNLHAEDLVAAFRMFHAAPQIAAVYNIGGGRPSSVSVLEAIDASERIAGRALNWTASPIARRGDHRWWISDLREFCADYPAFRVTRTVGSILQEIHDRFSLDA
jgi:CDP-paratose 2-epimerase